MATGKGNNQVRFEGALRFGPDLHVIAPWREWDWLAVKWTTAGAVPCTASLTKIYSRDQWHISRGGSENTWNAPNEVLGVDSRS